MSPKRPREWWISKGERPPAHFFWTAKVSTRIEDMPMRFRKPIHVVEYKAYKTAVDALKKILRTCQTPNTWEDLLAETETTAERTLRQLGEMEEER
jgi:hypothetical protein